MYICTIYVLHICVRQNILDHHTYICSFEAAIAPAALVRAYLTYLSHTYVYIHIYMYIVSHAHTPHATAAYPHRRPDMAPIRSLCVHCIHI